MAWKLGQDSFSKLSVYFTDGNKRFWYSIDWRSKYSKTRDRNLGLSRFEKKIAEWGNRAETVMIWDKETDTLIALYKYGKKINTDE